MKQPPLCYYDFETQSPLNLRTVGVNQYLANKHTRIMSCVFKWGDNVLTWLPHKQYEFPNCVYGTYMPEAIVKLLETHRFVAHNGEFFDELVWKSHNLLLPKHGFVDTMHLARAAGLPGGLEKACNALGLPSKSSSTAMLMLTEVKMHNGHPVYPIGPKTVWEKMLAYNVQDVEVLYELYQRVTELAPPNWPLLAAHREINQRGLLVDRPYLDQLIALWKQCQHDAKDEIAEMTGGALNADNIGSPKQVIEWLASVGIETNSVSVKSINDIMQNPEDFSDDPDEAAFAISVLLIRQNAVRATVGKLDRIVREIESDGKVRNSIVYAGAHTGRRSGRGVQVHNFPRGVDYEGELPRSFNYKQLQELYESNNKKHSIAAILTTLTRQVFIPEKGYKYSILDYAAIEPRGAAWVADCKYALSMFADHHADIYKTMAAKVTGKLEHDISRPERFLGKTMIIGLNYQMGGTKFDLVCKSNNIDLDALGLTAKQCVDIYRETFPEIKAIWKTLDEAAIKATIDKGSLHAAGRFVLVHDGERLRLQLPSGREILYRDARMEKVMTPWGQMKDAVVYTNPHGIRKVLYGGILLENGVQGMSFDMLAETGLTKIPMICLDVHDEVVSLIRKRAEFITNGCIMSTPPKWAKDFPLKVAGFIATEYRKGPKDKKETEFFRGKVLA